MKNLFTILMLITAIISLIYVNKQHKHTPPKQTEPNPHSIEADKNRLSELENSLNVIVNKLNATTELKIKRIAERDMVISEINQAVRHSKMKGSALKEELQNENSELNNQLWFQEIKRAFQNLNALNQDVLILKRREERLLNMKMTCEHNITTMKRIIEMKEGGYTPGEDSKFDELIASVEATKNNCYTDNLSPSDKMEIGIENDKFIAEVLENNITRIPGLTLKSADKLPALPDFTKKVKMSDQTPKTLYGRVRNDIAKIVDEVRKEAADYFKKQQPEMACSCWLEGIKLLKNTVNNAESLNKFQADFFKTYKEDLDTCYYATLRIMSDPYLILLSKSVEDMESKDVDWIGIAEAMEGLLRIGPKLTPSELEPLEEEVDTIRSVLSYLIKQNDLDAMVTSKRLETALDKLNLVYINNFKQFKAEERAKAEAEERAKAEAEERAKAEAAEKAKAEAEERAKAEAAKKTKAEAAANKTKGGSPNNQVKLVHVNKQNDDIRSKIVAAHSIKTTSNKPLEKEKTINEKTLPGAGDRVVETINGVEFAFRWCPAGSFIMGSPESENGRQSEETQHEETLLGFWILETMVTVDMFKAFVDDTNYIPYGDEPWGWKKGVFTQDRKYSWLNPGYQQENNYPVTCVSWYDAVNFCKWLSNKTGFDIHLPSEAQFEYACRAGSTDAYAGNLDDMAWYDGNSGAHPVGAKKPNSWGIYDMHGLAWEWTLWEDVYSSKDSTRPPYALRYHFRVIRGGGWNSSAADCRSANRIDYDPRSRNCYLGFRCVKECASI